MRNNVDVNCYYATGRDHELRELAKLWGIPWCIVVENCIHIGKLLAEDGH